MYQIQSSKPSRPFFSAGSEASETPLSTIVYRSRAKFIFPDSALQGLHDAQSRNRHEAVTGILVYDHPRFYQWLEGPAEGLTRIMDAIRQDSRHTDLEILRDAPIAARVFSGWSMKLAMPGLEPGTPWRDYLYPRSEVMHEMRQHPTLIPALLATLARNPQETQNALMADVHFTSRFDETLQSLIEQTVIPELATRHSLVSCPTSSSRDAMRLSVKQATENKSQVSRKNLNPDDGSFPTGTLASSRPVLALADLLLASDTGTALNLIHEQIGHRQSPLPFYTTLLEPAARRLGDLWLQDSCSEFDLTVALGHLQAAVRILGGEFMPRWLSPNAAMPNVLVVPLPGELHGLGAALDSEAMWQQGWSPRSEFPNDNDSLLKILKRSCFDVLDLTMSVALRREHWVVRLAETVRLARRASRNPDLVVMVGGRIFTEQGAGATDVNAEAAHQTAANITGDILQQFHSA